MEFSISVIGPEASTAPLAEAIKATGCVVYMDRTKSVLPKTMPSGADKNAVDALSQYGEDSITDILRSDIVVMAVDEGDTTCWAELGVALAYGKVIYVLNTKNIVNPFLYCGNVFWFQNKEVLLKRLADLAANKTHSDDEAE